MKTLLSLFAILVFSVLIFNPSFAQTWSSGSGGDIYYNGGDVGIGISSPEKLFHVKGSASTLAYFQQSATTSADAGIKIRGARNNSTGGNIAFIDLANWDSNEGGGTDYTMARISGGMHDVSGKTGYLRFYTHTGSSLSEKMRIDKNGNVGIGLTSPGSLLDMQLRTDTDFLRIRRNSATGRSQLVLADELGAEDWRFGMTGGGATDFAFFDGTQNALVLKQNGDAYFTPGGNVGIGTSAPDGKLHLKGGIAIAHPTVSYDTSGDAGARAGIIFGANITGNSMFWMSPDATTGNRLNIGTGTDYNDTNSKFTIVNNGNVGIGTTSPVEKFQIGSIWTFHDGGSKIIGYNYDYNSGAKRIEADEYAGIKFTSSGAIQFESAPDDIAGSDITASINLSISNIGEVGIGTTSTHGYKLAVAGGILAEKVYMEQQANWPDYVFNSKYNLRSLEETEAFIKENQHLPNIPSASEVEQNGYDLGQMNAKLLEKIEELTLHLINEHNRIDEILEENQTIKANNEQLQKRIEILESSNN